MDINDGLLQLFYSTETDLNTVNLLLDRGAKVNHPGKVSMCQP